MRDREYFTSRWSWSVKPFNDWYHIMAHTYGTWLPGDPKGFRTRHHRQHVDGDYRNPLPKGKYDALHRYAQSLMKRDPVILTTLQKHRVLEELIASLHKRNIEVIVLAVSKIHIHILARFPDHNPRKWIGIAKKESSHYLKQEDLAPKGGLWATRCKCLPINNRGHQIEAANYIVKHSRKGAKVWRMESIC